jgi:hypothetical protein
MLLSNADNKLKTNMKFLYRSAVVVFLGIFVSCQQQPQTMTEEEKETIKKQVAEQFNLLAKAINAKDASAWSEHYSKTDFISTIVATDYFNSRAAWVETITNYFSMRERQQMEPVQMRVTALAPNLALLTSEENSELC